MGQRGRAVQRATSSWARFIRNDLGLICISVWQLRSDVACMHSAFTAMKVCGTHLFKRVVWVVHDICVHVLSFGPLTVFGSKIFMCTFQFFVAFLNFLNTAFTLRWVVIVC